MRSEAQREASRLNGAKSKGPKTPQGKGVSKFNRLTHGLRAEEVVLPGESAAEFESLLSDYFDEWAPRTRTRAAPVERLAVADWKLRRATRADAAQRRMIADGAAFSFDNARRRRVDRAIEEIPTAPTVSMYDLESHADGLDRLITAWVELEGVLAGGPAGWDPIYHGRVMLLHGRGPDDGPLLVGPAGMASMRLRDDVQKGAARPAAEAEADVALLKGVAATKLERLRGLRAKARDPEAGRAEAIEAALGDVSHGVVLRAKYEMALERSYRSTLKKLMELAKTGDDLPDPDDPESGPPPSPPRPEPAPPSENKAPKPDAPHPGPAPATDAATVSGSVGAIESRPIRDVADASGRPSMTPKRAPDGPGGGGISR